MVELPLSSFPGTFTLPVAYVGCVSELAIRRRHILSQKHSLSSLPRRHCLAGDVSDTLGHCDGKAGPSHPSEMGPHIIRKADATV